MSKDASVPEQELSVDGVAAGDRSESDQRSDQAQSTSPGVLVGIPAYNEAATVGDVVTAARKHADEVLVVDDGSDDETVEQAKQAGARVAPHEQNEGYGASLGTIFRYAYVRDAEHLVLLDADGQHDEDDIPDLVRAQQETGAQVVIGSRFEGTQPPDMPAYRRFGLAVINLLVGLGLRVGYSYPSVSDTQCGFRTYDSEAITALANTADIGSGMGASLDVLFTAAQEGYDVAEVPTEVDYDVDDASTRHPVRHGVDLILSLFLAVARDRPVRAGLVTAFALVLGGGSVLTLGVVGVVAPYILLPVVVVLSLLVMSSLSGS